VSGSGLGKEIMDLAMAVNESNEALGKLHSFEGFTAGVSGCALHYVLSAKKWCESTGEKFDLVELRDTIIDHLVGSSAKKPIHHSLAEVVTGFRIGVMCLKNGFSESF